jgi:hypothetical protein
LTSRRPALEILLPFPANLLRAQSCECDAKTDGRTASEKGGRAVKNCDELKRIVFDFTGVFAVLLEVNRT